MQLRSAIISIIAFISIRLIKLSIKTKHKDNFNVISSKYSCFIKLPPLRIERLAYEDVISKQ